MLRSTVSVLTRSSQPSAIVQSGGEKRGDFALPTAWQKAAFLLLTGALPAHFHRHRKPTEDAWSITDQVELAIVSARGLI